MKYTWETQREFWNLPLEEQQRIFSTPRGDGYTCPTCGKFFAYHSGPPTSGGMWSCFVPEAADYIFHNEGCCSSGWREFCWGPYIK